MLRVWQFAKEWYTVISLGIVLVIGSIVILAAFTPSPLVKYQIVLMNNEKIEIEYKWCNTKPGLNALLVQCYGDSNGLEYSIMAKRLEIIE
jgi:hypothetical protein